MVLLLESFGAYATAQLPASGKWTTAAGVTITAGGGRSGASADNCALFDTAQSSILRRTLTPTAVAGVYTVTLGLAVQVLSQAGTLTLCGIDTAISRFDLQLLANGSLQLIQTTGGILLGTICTSGAAIVPIGTGGIYLELQIRFEAGLVTACTVRASDQYNEMNTIAQGALLALAAGDVPSAVRIGGGVGDAAGSWNVADVYATDGVPASALAWRGQLIFNDSFLGNTHVQALYPTSDGANQSTGNTPWVPSAGEVWETLSEHPPDDDASYAAADTASQTSTMLFAFPTIAPFGRVGCSGIAIIYAIQWVGRLRAVTGAVSVVPLVRRLLTGILATDAVEPGTTQVVTDTDYEYYPSIWDRNPTLSDLPWTFTVFRPAGIGVLGTTEFGMSYA